MDRNSVIGLVLIAGIIIIFSWLNSPEEEDVAKKKEEAAAEDSIPKIEMEGSDTIQTTEQDTLAPVKETTSTDDKVAQIMADSTIADSVKIQIKDSIRMVENIRIEQQLSSKYGVFTQASEYDAEDSVVLQNNKIRVLFTNKGAMIRKVELMEHMSYQAYSAGKTPEKAPYVLLDSTNDNFMDLLIEDENSRTKINTQDFDFKVQSKTDTSVNFRLQSDGEGYLDFYYSISDGYEMNHAVRFKGLEKSVLSKGIAYHWNCQYLSQEKSRDQEQQISGIYYKYGKDSWDYLSERESSKSKIGATPEWIAFKHNFFSAVLMNNDKAFGKDGVMGHKVYESGNYVKNFYTRFDNVNISNTANDEISMQWYFGPNDYEILAQYDNEMTHIVSMGPGLFGWLNRNIFNPIFSWLADFGVGFGAVILLLTIFVRLIITPLVFRNYKSSAKMRVLKPEIEEINKKYEDNKDPMKKQQEVMALYRSTGVNPMAGCIPMLIQMPILFAMFRFIPSIFDLRQSSFLWADDLSAYDAVATLGFEIPFYGDHVSLFTLLMAGSTLAYTTLNSGQMASGGPGMPNMKFMMYLFPIMMIFFFNSYSSGLSYYYFLSNLMSMGIMLIIKNRFIDEDKIRQQLQANKKKPKKKSKFQKRLEEMQKQQRAKKGRKR